MMKVKINKINKMKINKIKKHSKKEERNGKKEKEKGKRKRKKKKIIVNKMKDLHGGNVDRGHDISVPLVSLRAHLDSSYGGVGVALEWRWLWHWLKQRGHF